MDLFAPRKALTKHLEKLIEIEVIRGVKQAEEFADVMSNHNNATHAVVYVVFDKSKNLSTQGKSTIKSTEVYTVVLAWRNSQPVRSGHGNGMDDAGTVKSAIEFHVHGWTIDNEYQSKSTGKPFSITDSPEAFYRDGGWAFYPMSFEIGVTRMRQSQN